ncbi:hypothetical protein [Ruegeria sp.]|uniref:hypothetical protein n=1 Tax=Ruegeria sp. TaxID=1879320 RepID=UPI003B5A9D79
MFIQRFLSAIPLVTAITVVAVPANSGPKLPTDCVPDPSKGANCVPILACLGQDGVYFTGRAVGWNSGTFAGQSSAAFACFGEWLSQGSFGLGEAKITCDNALTGRAFFTYQHPETGTATGLGFLSNGEPFRVWTGFNVEQFLLNEYGDINTADMCKAASKPIS